MAMYLIGFKIGDILYSKEYDEVGELVKFCPPQEAQLQTTSGITYCNINECVLNSEMQQKNIQSN